MKTIKYTYWKDGEYYLGYWNDFPEYQTQALSKEELIENSIPACSPSYRD